MEGLHVLHKVRNAIEHQDLGLISSSGESEQESAGEEETPTERSPAAQVLQADEPSTDERAWDTAADDDQVVSVLKIDGGPARLGATSS